MCAAELIERAAGNQEKFISPTRSRSNKEVRTSSKDHQSLRELRSLKVLIQRMKKYSSRIMLKRGLLQTTKAIHVNLLTDVKTSGANIESTSLL